MARLRARLWREVDLYVSSGFSVIRSSKAYIEWLLKPQAFSHLGLRVLRLVTCPL